MTLTAATRTQIAAETEFWREDPYERPGVDTVRNFLNKSSEASVFAEAIAPYASLFASARRIVEVGGGQGWASALVKRSWPHAHVTLTDAVAEGVAGHVIWERVHGVTLDAVAAAPAQQLPVDDASADLVFAFAAAHHFVDQHGALAEAFRVLRPGGTLLWLYEPAAPAWCHPLASWRVRRTREIVPEHVLSPSAVLRDATAVGFASERTFFPSVRYRGPKQTVYYGVLRLLPPLQYVLPCGVNFRFTRPMVRGMRTG